MKHSLNFQFLILSLMGILLTIPLDAQRRVGVRAQTSSEIKLFKVKPGDVKRRLVSRVAPIQKPVNAAAPVTAAKKKVWIKDHGTLPPPPMQMDIKAKAKPTLDHVILSAKDPYYGQLGHLEFNEVRHLDAKGDYVQWYQPNSGMGFMKTYVKLEKGSKYLVDFNISCDDTREFHLSTTGGSQKTTFGKGSHHLVSILEATGSGTISMMLWADHQWSFYNVEITKLE